MVFCFADCHLVSGEMAGERLWFPYLLSHGVLVSSFKKLMGKNDWSLILFLAAHIGFL